MLVEIKVVASVQDGIGLYSNAYIWNCLYSYYTLVNVELIYRPAYITLKQNKRILSSYEINFHFEGR